MRSATMRIEKKRIWLAVLTITTLLLYIGSFEWLLRSWLTMDAYSHGFLIPFVSGFLVWQKRNLLREASSRRSPLLFIGAVLLYLAGQFTGAVFIATLSLIPFLLGLILLFKGYEAARGLAFPISFLIFAIPLPAVDLVTLTLQSVSTILATAISHLAGVESSFEGCQILLDGTIFEIAPACSGFNSIISLYTIVALLSYLIPDPLMDKVILFAATLPIAIFTNGLRIGITLIVASQYGVETGMKYFHGWGGLTFYIIALLSIFALLGCIRWTRKISTEQ
ncbi:Transmembrane exosortase (Exosortase_EpsH) [Candidatus Methanoperedenaceae archaeon GB50]|nr:Transmembrane exosortase (Exosortase_EpsH) [Candidatus Methanoperedenaceae archaeon GB50]CAD7773518.1 MAG: Transmembrane exosortase (Exosortase_EpsH) [Candidatus Methanoperedenaceae archaeon GB50]